MLIILFVFNLYSVYQNGKNIYEGLENDQHIKRENDQHIKREDVPPGEEHLYILKSKIVPPVCPKCPTVVNIDKGGGDNSKCQPCPPCGRCPKSDFECKKVPIYQGESTRRIMPFMQNPSMTPLQR
jgi:hypothetical protein